MQAKNNHSSPPAERRPNLGGLYLKGLLVYLGFRLAALGETLLYWLSAPLRLSWALSQAGWVRLKPWLIRHKRRLLWSLLAIACLSLLVGGAVSLYLWRAELLGLATRLKDALAGLLGRWRRRPAPVLVVASQAVEAAPVAPSFDSPVP